MSLDLRNINSHKAFTKLGRKTKVEDLKRMIDPKQFNPEEKQLAAKKRSLLIDKGIIPRNDNELSRYLRKMSLYVQLVPILLKASDMLNDLFGDLDSKALSNSKIYKALGTSLKQIDTFLDGMYANTDVTEFYIDQNKEVMRLDRNIEKFHPEKLSELNDVLEYLLENDTMSIHEVVKARVNSNNKTLSNFNIDKRLKKRLNQFNQAGVNVLNIPLHQLALLIPRERLENTKGFGAESIKILDGVFRTVKVQW